MSLPTPYYQDDLVTLYHADCRELLPLVEADVVVTDPPYGIGYNRGRDVQGKHIGSDRRQIAPVIGDDEPFDPTPVLALGLPTILWGANCYADRLPVSPVWVVRDKVLRNGLRLRIGECEIAWTNCVGRSQVYRHLWSGGYRAADQDRAQYLHPTQKPVALMEWCLSLVPKARVALDPYAGSGSTLVAAKRRGMRAIGIEIEERYCEVAANRLRQDVLGLSA